MFGYVNVFRDDLKVKDYMNFRAYYCGLCRSIGKNCSHLSRLGLSYDMTFLAILLSSLSPDITEYIKKPCVAHPFRKRASVIGDNAVDYAADISVILFYCKMKDDWHDDRSFAALSAIIAFRKAYKKASSRHPALTELIIKQLSALSELEKQNCADTDLTADCFAKITEAIFSPDFIGEKNKRPAAWLGYNIGRWIYIIDAYADIDKDLKKKNYNPFLAGFNNKNIDGYKLNLAKQLDLSLTFTLENAVSGLDLMKIYKNEEILKNILYLSLKLKQDEILGILTENKECKS